MKKYFILLVGESGSGKTTTAEKLYEKYGFKSLLSYTTRPPRYEGEGGHIFVSDEQFDKLTNMVGYTCFDGKRYCATAQQVEENDVYVIDPAGVTYFFNAYTGSKTPLIFFIDTTKRTRRHRMLERGDDKRAVKARLKHDKMMFREFRRRMLWDKEHPVFPIPGDCNTPEECAECIHAIVEFFKEREAEPHENTF